MSIQIYQMVVGVERIDGDRPFMVFTRMVVELMVNFSGGCQIHFVGHYYHRYIGHVPRFVHLFTNGLNKMEARRDTDIVDQYVGSSGAKPVEAVVGPLAEAVGWKKGDHGQVDQLQLKEAFVEDQAGKVFGFLLGLSMLLVEFIGHKPLQ